MRIILIVLFFCSVVISCSNSKTPEQINVKKSQIDSTRFSIIFDYFWNEDEIEYSTLHEDEINKVLLSVEDRIDKHNENAESYWKINLEKYRFQLVPIINQQGIREVWVNSFCFDYSKISQYESDWRKRAIVVFDGGKCYFNLKVNLNTFEAYDLGINGEA